MGSHGRKPPDPRGVPKQHGRKPPMGKPQHGRKPPSPPQRTGKTTCCAMAAAYGAARRGKFRLARRYAVLSMRLIAARMPVGDAT